MILHSAFRSLALSLSLLGLSTDIASAVENSAFNAALHSIDSSELQQHANVLADDTFEGRESGSRGGRAAAGYLVNQLEQYGMDGAGTDGSFYQAFGSGYRNILAKLPGSDPQLKSEVILIGAHYDHVGYGNPSNSFGPTGYIHNGADDNASGTSGLLEVIEAFSKLPEPPARTIVFAFWDGEEKGLLGSKHFVRRPTVKLAEVKLLINMDMIGRLQKNTLKVYGSRTGFGFRRLASEHNTEQMLLDFDWEIKENSDHHPFYSRNIPYLMFHTGLHDDYHRPRDDADKLNSAGMQMVSRLVFSLVYDVATKPQPGNFRREVRSEPLSTVRKLEAPVKHAPPRVGVTWKNELSQNSGLRITSVIADTPAEQASLTVGDRLMTLNGRAIASEDDFRRDLLAASAPFELGVQREGMAELQHVEIVPAGNPIRLGISWRVDAAEPGTLIVILSVPGSPAQQAGIRVGDRIYSIAGQQFEGTEDFQQKALALPSPLELQVERNGQLRTAVLELAAPLTASE